MRDLILFVDSNREISHSLLKIVDSLNSINRVVWVYLNYLKLGSKTSSPVTICGQENPLSNLFSNRKIHDIRIEIGNIAMPLSQLDRTHTKFKILNTLCPILSSHKISRPMIWTSEVLVADIFGHFNDARLVYLCDKEDSSNDPIRLEQEQSLIRQSDIIFGSNEKICRRFPANKTFLLQQGVDLKLFCNPTNRASDFPNNNRPTAGFYGVLDNSVDYQLLLLVALNLPDWNFVVIGEIKLPFYPLPKLDNVYYLGPKSHQTLPRYSQHWQASILPTIPTARYSTGKHATLLEYLAVGAPIITTDHHVTGRFSKYINVVENAHEMSEALIHAAYEPKWSADIVFSDSWQVRSRYIDNILQVIPK